MNYDNLSIFKNKLELITFARGYIAGMPKENKCVEENDEWCQFSDEVDLNFYTLDGYICVTAYKIIDGLIDTNQFEDIHSEKVPYYIIPRKN